MKLVYVKGCWQFLLILLYLQNCDAQNGMMMVLMSVVCWKNSELTTTKDSNKKIFKSTDEETATKGKPTVIRTRKENSFDKICSLG